MLDPRRYHYQPTISFPVSDDRIQQKPHTNNNISETKKHVEDESGMCSPPLWTTKSKSNNYRSLSPESKTQAIERGQRELMEMVKNMPESSYELTLKDLVEDPKVHHVEENNKVKERNLSNKNTRKREGNNSTSRNNSKKNIDSGGLYLKMVFPISLGSSKKHDKKKELLVNNKSSSNSKVSPRASVSDGSVNKDWWKKKLGSSGSECGGESDHSGVSNGSMKRYGSSSTSSCSSRSNSRHEMSTSSRCWPFMRRSEILSEK